MNALMNGFLALMTSGKRVLTNSINIIFKVQLLKLSHVIDGFC